MSTKEQPATAIPALNGTALASLLWQTAHDIKSGLIHPAHADSIATQARELIRLMKVRQELASQLRKPIAKDMEAFATE